ncbi:MAG: hypothetical protein H5T74_13465 [Actinobacteria bacterium]|nr:hypothetical protein [Actinomycetota bacterium]
MFKRGDPARFDARRTAWLDMVPDILVGLAPVAAGIILLVRDSSWAITAATAGVILLATAGNSAVCTRLACK